MSFQHSSSISSDDEFLNRRLRSSMYRNGNAYDYLRQFDSVNRHDEYIPYSKDKHRKQENKFKSLYIERLRRPLEDINCRSSETDTEDEIEYSKSVRNLSLSRRNRLYHPANDIYQACQVTINYRKDSSSSSSETDQILIKQKQNNAKERILVYKGYLKSDERFSFKSQRFCQYPFDIKFYINGYFQYHLLTCCEYKYHQGQFRLNQFFSIQQIQKSIPCSKCRKRSSLSDSQSLKTKSENKLEEENNHLQSTQSIDQNSLDKQEEIKDEKLTEQRTDENNNRGSLFQSLLALLQNGLPRTEVRQPLPPRHQGNVENFVVLLLGVCDQSNLLHSIFNFVKIFDQIEELNSFVETLKLEKILLIVDDSFIESVEDFSRFESIYFLSNNKKWQKQHSTIRGNYPDLKSICQQIEKEFFNEKNLILIESVSSDEKENEEFCYLTLLKETILKEDNEGNLKKDFLDYSRFHYQNNSIQLNLIEQFENNFTMEKSIWWLTTNSFIQKMLYRAFRTQEIEILFKMRWIIQSVNQQIKQNQFSKTVYRIFHLSINQFEKIQENVNGLITFGTFLDCSLNRPLSSIEDLNNNQNYQTILFQIKTTNGIEIKELRHPDSNIEVLLSFDNIYQIKSIEPIEKHYFLIQLILIEKENEQFKELTDQMREEIDGPVTLIQLAKLLILNKNYLQTDYLARLLFNDNSLKDNPTLLASLAAVHHLLGSQDHRQNNHKAARLQFEQSLKIFLSFIPEDNQILSATYNNIGSMFYQEDNHEQAIVYHQKALQCQLKSSTPDIESIATYSGNIGAVYLDQKNYEQALINYQRSLQILQQTTPGGESQSIGLVYDRIASVYWRMDRPEDALNFYQKALELELKYLPENDHKMSVSYFNLSTAFAKLNRLDDAIDAAEKSIQQLLKSVPPDHPEVKENTEQLEGLRRKKWLQQLYR